MKSLDVTVVVPKVPEDKGANGSIIRIAMSEDSIHGSPSDYVILDGGALITSFGNYVVTSKLNEDRVDVRNVDGDGAIDSNLERTIVHRKNLWRYIGSEARKFWKFGRRTRR